MAHRFHQRFLQRSYLAYSRFARGMTLGVRAMLLKDGGVLLVKHSYMPGWYFPGGGVEAGETVGDALVREIVEEAGVALSGPAQLFGMYRNRQADSRDHVALFVCRDWEQRVRPKPNAEIVGCELFPLDALPAGTTPATRSRLREVLEGVSQSSDW